MGTWACGIDRCGGTFERPDRLIRHQALQHPSTECRVCGETVPAGYFGIQHAFEEHTRAEFVRAYNANSDAIRQREELIDLVEEEVDVQQLKNQLRNTSEETAVSADD